MAVGIKIRELCFSYGSQEVLSEINMVVKPGDFIGIVGPNGSGKSTLLKNMAALLRPTRGAIEINSTGIEDYKRLELARLIALVGQDQQPGFNFQVEEVVYTGRYPYKERFRPPAGVDRQAVERAMYLTGCYHLKDRDLFSLSGGERQRVFLARALAQETPVLLLDEPTAFLDMGYQVELLQLLQGLNLREKLTVVAVMHDLNLASRYSRKLVMLNRGKIFARGSPEEVLTRDHILEVYRTEVLLEPHPMGGPPQIIPISPPTGRKGRERGRKIHVIGGGGSATGIINQLFLKGLTPSAGVLSIGDSDWVTARRLGLEMVEESPFSPIGLEQHRKNLGLVADASLVVLAPLFLGPGNLLNIEAALWGLEEGKTVLVLEPSSAGRRDFTGGPGGKLYQRLVEGGALLMEQFDLEKIDALLATGAG